MMVPVSGCQGTVQAEVDVSEDNIDDGTWPGHEEMVQAKAHVGALQEDAQQDDKKRKRPQSSLEKNKAARNEAQHP